jgi:hypothetical protein
MLSDPNNVVRFGLFTAFSIGMTFLADVLFAPARMQLTARFSNTTKKTANA